ncbi:MAG: uracil-DNA glycosylase, partial [Gemmatimonadaceae bacterium]
MRDKNTDKPEQTAAVRAYFAQQREGGERDLILSAPTVPALGAAAPVSSAAPASGWRDALRAIEAAPADATRVVGSRSAGASASPVTRNLDTSVSRASSAAPGKRAWHADVALEHIPVGLIVGSSSHDMFAGARDTFASLPELERAVASCKRCVLYRGAKNPVPGEGDPNADLMCVGEAPGATEDDLGRPFVGQAGKLLTQILAAIDLPREKVYICNVLKHRPPNNRNPLPDEVKACQPYLVRQVELIRPKVILALGTFAAQ